MPASPEPPNDRNPYQQAGMALMIPMMMLAAPLVGYGIGWLIRRWTGWGSWIEIVFLVLGLIAGARETLEIIRRIK